MDHGTLATTDTHSFPNGKSALAQEPSNRVPSAPLIHPTAVVHPAAQIHSTVKIGPYAVIGERVSIGAHTQIGPHVIIDGWTEIGERNQIFAGAAIGMEPQDLKYNGAESLVSIGNDNRIREYVTINRATHVGEATRLGNGNLLMAYVHIAHNCLLEDQIIITNSVSLAGHVQIEAQARIGGLLGIHQFVRIGRLAMVGGMSRIDRDVPPYTLVEGNPSRVRSLNRVGLERSGVDSTSLKKAFRTLYRSGLNLVEALDQLEAWIDDPQVQHLTQFLRASQQTGRRGPIPGRRA
ncbi:acyl-ACP--UDP-N-acetylglucosamine O-acyltransferase [Leptolyngbya sp. FACHB-261]|uniref:acyl-ACP--UDP-N-acetylglucosamine O-acyltransferase n=1 Tax=Leptolyngbya sp. FACHB-261 TaxID=2692806 RepID=UPI001684AE0D|nr:acyl-ACP--UDP-N-acetylglucosamine O-acyltransferase [Leptolyngbya sp. FACHB-261]MBD2101172.1 acyl-ACP--UDP-N-acetylglucosamine O-acyltransferase [Leptolyngbya sp. FACHB-261]